MTTNHLACIQEKASKAYMAIAAFVFFYLLLIGLAIVFAILCVLLAIYLISQFHNLWVLLGGVGLIGTGILVLVFVLKFIFKNHKVDRSGMVEVKASEHPRLFEMINEIATQLDTPLPLKVYLTPEVNAFVFYDSSFWSMFLPIRKNLAIGAGLVNGVNITELRAIVAHEFGHFSQSSMKTGSYVYYVNQIIFHQLEPDPKFETYIRGFASIHSVFGFFMEIGFFIIQTIQRVLGELYQWVNKKYMSLSRAMEFQADEIAAQLIGKEALTQALLKLDFVSIAYENTLKFFDLENITSNIYPCMTLASHEMAKDHQIEVAQGLPVVSKHIYSVLNRSFLVVNDQWASHPSILDRVKKLERLNAPTLWDMQPAWELFSNPADVQAKLTSQIFSLAPQTSKSYALTEFQERWENQTQIYDFPATYRKFYDQNDILALDPEFFNHLSFDDIHPVKITDAILEEQSILNALENDKISLTYIVENPKNFKSFEFSNRTFSGNQASKALTWCEKKINKIKPVIEKFEKDFLAYHYKLAKDQGNQTHWETLYTNYLNGIKTCKNKSDFYLEIQKEMEFVQVETPYDIIEQRFMYFKDKNEKILKEQLSAMMEAILVLPLVLPYDVEALQNFLAQEIVYFENKSYNNHSLSLLHNALNAYSFYANFEAFYKKKAFLEFQANL